MTAFTTLSNDLVGVGAKPFATTVQALRDNPVAIGEADSSVPLNLLPTVYLGAISTTSGTSQSITGLVLTPYRQLLCVFAPVSLTTVGTPALTLSLAGCQVHSATLSNPSFRGSALFDLDNGNGSSITANVTLAAPSSAVGQSYGLRSNISNASTSIAIACTGTSTTFGGGSLRIYGVK
jgi:hypothetical protein